MAELNCTAGIDIGSTYTKAVIVDASDRIVGRAMRPTGFQLAEAAETAFREALVAAGLAREDVGYVVATGFGRHQASWADLHVTDLTAAARGATRLFPGTRTILDVGGQTMKASGVTEDARVRTFRLNDKCAAGTGAFLEKTARYMGYSTAEIGPLVATSREPMQISGVCAVFAESEVINHLSQGAAPADIMQGAIVSLVGRSVQLMKRVRMEPEFTLIGGILRFSTMVEVTKRELQSRVNVPDGDLVQFVPAFGAAILGRRRRLQRETERACEPTRNPARA
ncbi:MAG: acyl-CoA dehydratase activase [Gaiellaceae bacterium]